MSAKEQQQIFFVAILHECIQKEFCLHDNAAARQK